MTDQSKCCQVFPLSTRFSSQAISSLLRSVSAHRVLTTPTVPQTFLASIQAEMNDHSYDFVMEPLPAFDDIYPELFGIAAHTEDFPLLPLPSPDAYPNGVEIWLHSSGSTGQPKPLPLTHAFLHKLQFSRKCR
jgi:acyl-coenzyme A synthetase/AMP-(fatty) acid ligase